MNKETKFAVISVCGLIGVSMGITFAFLNVADSMDCSNALEMSNDEFYEIDRPWNNQQEMFDSCVSAKDSMKILVIVIFPLGAIVFSIWIIMNLARKDYTDKDLSDAKEGSPV